MKIESGFMKSVISKLVKTMIRKKVGYNVDIRLNQINITITDGTAHVHLNADAELDKTELAKILKKFGLD